MGDLKPIGSEKLTGDAKIKRIMEIARFGETNKNDEYHTATNYFTKKGADGNTYSIVQEFDGYYLKCGINESTLDYISGLMNKKKDRYKSYGAALKRMNLIFKPLNEEYNGGKQISMYEQTLEDEMEEQEKFVLNVPDEGGDEEMDMDLDMEDDMGDEEMDMDLDMEDEEGEEIDLDMEDEEGEEDEEVEMEGFMKPIQKLTGKLGQKLRDVEEELGSEDIKYVLNSIISAVDLDNLEEDDKEDILERFEEDEDAAYGDDEEMDIDMDDMGDEDMDMDDEEISLDDEGGEEIEDEEIVATESLKNRIGTLLESYIEKKTLKSNPKEFIKNKLSEVSRKKEITVKSSSVEQELTANKFIKENINFKLKGRTKKGDLVFVSENKKILINTRGIIK